MILTDERIPLGSLEAGTGWHLDDRGACRGEICVPLQVDTADGRVAASDLAAALGMPLIRHDDEDLWALGPATHGGRALPTAEAPELVLPDISGKEFRLTELRGKKVVLVAWSPY